MFFILLKQLLVTINNYSSSLLYLKLQIIKYSKMNASYNTIVSVLTQGISCLPNQMNILKN